MRIGELLKSWRVERKMSRRKLAAVLGIDHVTLLRIEEQQSVSISHDSIGKIVCWMFGK